MSLREYHLDKGFDILATWFREGEKYENGVKGKLHYSSTSIVLEIYGSFENRPIDQSEKNTRLYGFSQKGKLLVLNQCIKVNEATKYPGFEIECYSVDTFYMFSYNLLDSSDELPINSAFSKLFKEPREDLQVESVQFSLNHLNSWMNKNLMRMAFDELGYKSQRFSIQSQKIIVSEGVVFRDKRKGTNHILEGNYFLEIFKKNQRKKSFQSFLKSVSQIKKLIEFLSSAPLHYDYVEFLLPKELSSNKVRIKGRCFFKQIGKRINHLPQNILSLNLIESEFENILDNWFLKQDKLSFIVDGYLNDLYLAYYIETKLVNSIRNLEVYYRNFVSNPHFIEEKRKELESDQQLLLSFLDKEVSEKNKKHFTQNIMYVGEESLRAKLNYLIKELPEQLFDACIKLEDKSPSKSRTSFVNTLIETRNFYTHGDAAGKYPDRVKVPNDFLVINEKLKIIQRYYIYEELGLTEELILKILLPEAYSI